MLAAVWALARSGRVCESSKAARQTTHEITPSEVGDHAGDRRLGIVVGDPVEGCRAHHDLDPALPRSDHDHDGRPFVEAGAGEHRLGVVTRRRVVQSAEIDAELEARS